jgi:hypothetical protein
MVLIRSDGRVEIYSINDDSCNIICKYDTQEHLTGLDIGKFKVKDKTEIILSSLSGLVFSLCPNIQSNKQKFQTIDKKTLTKNLFTEEQEVSTLHRAYDSKLEEFNKKQRALRRYFLKAYKYWIFKALPKLKKKGKIDGKYEIELPIDEVFKRVYGPLKIMFTVLNDVVILEDILPDKILMKCFERDLPTYKGIPYYQKKDLKKLKIMEKIING